MVGFVYELSVIKGASLFFMYGVAGAVVYIDLSTGRVEKIKLGEEVYKKFLGGVGLGAWFLLSRMAKGTDPLGPGNVLGFVSGLLNLSNVPLAGRFMAVGKSPLTGGWGDANAGGRFGPKLKEAGFDAVFICGVSEKPVYILIENGEVYIESAADLWGKTTKETEDELRRRHRGAQVVSIGPAGEKQQLVAAIINEYGRALGRSGLGAVMGSKRLKAVVAVGDKRVEVYDRDLLRQKIVEIVQLQKGPRARAAEIWHKYGTLYTLEPSILSGDTPLYNWRGLGYEEVKRLAEVYKADYFIKDNVKPYACASCTVACGALIKSRTKYGEVEGHRAEYETASLFGPALLNLDRDSVVYINELCNLYGLDTISTANVVGFAMELYERGVLSEREVGFPLKWGDAEAVIRLVELIGKGEGIGRVLGQGVKKACEIIGKGACEYAMHVGGQELPAHHVKYLPGLAVTYVADPTPARHTAGGVHFMGEGGRSTWTQFDFGINFGKVEKYAYKDKGRIAAVYAKAAQVENSLGFCAFSSQVVFRTLPYVELIYAFTGLKFTPQELLEVGHRIQTMRKLFNIREGVNPTQWKLPKRALEYPKEGPLSDVKMTEEDVELMRREYYEEMGWDPATGAPRRATLEKLGILDLAEGLDLPP